MQQPNEEQVKTVLRWLITVFGGGIAGWFAAKGWFTVDQVQSILNSPVVMSTVVALVPLVWGILSKTRAKLVAAVNRMPEVAGVVTKFTPAGIALANKVNETAVTIAGTPTAQVIATKGEIA